MTPQQAGSDRNQSAICSHRHDEQRGLICKKTKKTMLSRLRWTQVFGTTAFVPGCFGCFAEECRPMARRPSPSVIVRSAPAVGGTRLFTRHITGCRCSAKRGGFAPSHKNPSTRRRRKREGRYGSQGAQRELTSDPTANIASKGEREKKKNHLPQIGSYDRQFVSHRLSGRWTATALQFPMAKRPEEASTQPSVA